MSDQNLFRDFDAAWEERAKTAPRFKAFGREYVMPTSPPLKLTLTLMRSAEKGPDAVIDPDTVLDLTGALIGRDNVKSLLDAGMTIDQFEDVLRFASSAYGLDDDGEADGGPPAAGGPAGQSSPTGPPSKPTSSGSTDWLS